MDRLHVNSNKREAAQERAFLVNNFLGQRKKNPGDGYNRESQPPSPLVGLGEHPVFVFTYGYLDSWFSKPQSRHDNGG